MCDCTEHAMVFYKRSVHTNYNETFPYLQLNVFCNLRILLNEKKSLNMFIFPKLRNKKKTYWYGNPGIVLERTIVKVYPELLRTLERCIADYFQCKKQKLNCIYCHCVENPQHSLKPKLLDTTCVLWLAL